MATSTTGMRASAFWTWLRECDPYPKSLAWCHTTDGYALRKIIQSGSFIPKPCRVFKEDLLYFFYGRPGYRVGDDSSLQISSRAPVVVMLANELILNGKRLFPFDTGAFKAKRYSQWMHKSMELKDFELECPGDAPQRFVAAFFGSNRDYLRVKPRAPHLPYSGEFEVESIVTLLTDRRGSEADDRRTVVELQSGSPVHLKPPIVRALIVPDELATAPFLVEYIKHAGSDIEIVGYPLTPLKQAKEYQALLEGVATQFQEKWGMV